MDRAFAYEGIARELVARAKYRHARAALTWLGEAIARSVSSTLRDGRDVDMITWAPASATRRHANGIDHGEVLARVVGRTLGLPVGRCLTRRGGMTQTGAARSVRSSGPVLHPALRVPGLQVLVIDDVATTGATLAAASRTLRAAGAVSVAAATATRTRRPGDT